MLMKSLKLLATKVQIRRLIFRLTIPMPKEMMGLKLMFIMIKWKTTPQCKKHMKTCYKWKLGPRRSLKCKSWTLIKFKKKYWMKSCKTEVLIWNKWFFPRPKPEEIEVIKCPCAEILQKTIVIIQVWGIIVIVKVRWAATTAIISKEHSTKK